VVGVVSVVCYVVESYCVWVGGGLGVVVCLLWVLLVGFRFLWVLGADTGYCCGVVCGVVGVFVLVWFVGLCGFVCVGCVLWFCVGLLWCVGCGVCWVCGLGWWGCVGCVVWFGLVLGVGGLGGVGWLGV
jgi:hypothetical protein